MSPNAASGGRPSAVVAGEMRESIAVGNYEVGQFLPSVRELSDLHAVARETVRRALKMLEADGLVRSEPRHGFRVLSKANDPARGLPVAFVVWGEPHLGRWSDIHEQIWSRCQRSARTRNWSTLTLAGEGVGRAEVLERLKTSRASGALIDSEDRELLESVIKMGLPALMVDSFNSTVPLDTVAADNFRGGLLAAEHLSDCGCKRVGWLGPVADAFQSIERWGGAVSGVRHFGMTMPDRFVVNTSMKKNEWVEAQARKLLSGRDRPDGVVALWSAYAGAVGKVAGELGLKLGKDFHLVGWSLEERFQNAFATQFVDQPVPPAVTWSVANLAETAMARLAERRENRDLPPIRLSIDTKIRRSSDA